MTPTESLVRQFYEALNQQGAPVIVRATLADNWTVHPPLPGEGSDADRYLTAIRPIFQALPDFRIEVLDLIEAGDSVAVRGQVTATHADTLFGVPATRRTVTYMTQDFHRIEDGRIAESWHVEDWLSVLFQIGAFPA